MLEKKCDYCLNFSYSASDHETWICPYCNKDITHVMPEGIGKNDKETPAGNE